METKRSQANISIPDVPLQQTLPLLRQDNVSEVIDLIINHLDISKYNDAHLVFNCIEYVFIHLKSNNEIVYKTLKLLTNLSCIDGSSEYLMKNDHTLLIQNLFFHQNEFIRRQTVWYLSNVVTEGLVVYNVFKSIGILKAIEIGLQTFPHDIDYCQKIGYLVGTIASLSDVSNEEVEMKTEEISVEMKREGEVTSVNFSQPIIRNQTLFDELLPLFSLIYPRIKEITSTYYIIAMFSQNELNAKKLIKSVPTILTVISDGLASKERYVRENCIVFCVSIIDMKQKYPLRLINQPGFISNLSQAVFNAAPMHFIDLCYLCSNMIALEKEITPVLLQVNLVQRMIQKLDRFDFSEKTESLVDLKIEFGWFYLNVISTLPVDQVTLVICGNNTFKALTIIADCLLQDSKEFIETFLSSCVNIINKLLDIEFEMAKNFIDLLEESGVTNVLHKLDYGTDAFSIPLNNYFYAIDRISHLEENEN